MLEAQRQFFPPMIIFYLKILTFMYKIANDKTDFEEKVQFFLKYMTEQGIHISK